MIKSLSSVYIKFLTILSDYFKVQRIVKIIYNEKQQHVRSLKAKYADFESFMNAMHSLNSLPRLHFLEGLTTGLACE